MSIRVRALAVLAAIAVVACGRTPSPVEPVVEPPEPSDGTTVVAPAGTTIVWTKGESPCFILDTLTVERHETLVVEPGVDVLFADSAYAEILGAIRALGTEADSIRFIPAGALERPSVRQRRRMHTLVRQNQRRFPQRDSCVRKLGCRTTGTRRDDL